jgi:hypothetical protein
MANPLSLVLGKNILEENFNQLTFKTEEFIKSSQLSVFIQ